jgi:O-antigen ligase
VGRYSQIAGAEGWASSTLCAAGLEIGRNEMTLSPSRFYLVVLGILLSGYALFDRGFAYLGVESIFIGEAVLALGLLCVLANGVATIFRLPAVWPLLAFMAWGAFRTLPYIRIYGMDALRDGAIWGYALFAVMTALCLLRSGWLGRVLEMYGRLLPAFLILEPILLAVSYVFGDDLPTVPGSTISVITVKAGDAGVHYAGIAAFLLLGFVAQRRGRTLISRQVREWILWTYWAGGSLVVAALSRGGMLTIVSAIFLVFLIKPLPRRLSRIAFTGILLVLCLLPFAASIDVEEGRSISPGQVGANITSIVDNSPGTEDGTKEWRLEWWDDIIHYTVFGDYFWLGKGFGINLADDDGFQVFEDSSLRSPHNGHLTILARMGVPGLLLWVALQLTFVSGLVRAVFRARRRREEAWARFHIWILVYWFAFMVNGSFDVFLEGPQGGIWFWSLFGFGTAAMELQRQALRAPDQGGTVRSGAHAAARG